MLFNALLATLPTRFDVLGAAMIIVFKVYVSLTKITEICQIKKIIRKITKIFLFKCCGARDRTWETQLMRLVGNLPPRNMGV